MSLREEIKDYLNEISANAITVEHGLEDIIKTIEKRIDSIMQREITDSHHFEIQQLKNDLSTTDAIVRICREIKEILK